MFSIPTNFDQKLNTLFESKNIHEIYGKLPLDPLGGSRGGMISSKKINITFLKKYIKTIHKSNLKFNYLLNTYYTNNIEHTVSGRRIITNFLDKLAAIDVDTITVANPHLATLIKKNHPHIKIDVSVILNIANIQELKKWEDIGVNTITLSPIINRDFEALTNIRSKTKINLKLLINQGCMYPCIYSNYHYLACAESSRNYSGRIENIPDYSVIRCKHSFIKNPENFIKATWIRPEDIKTYRSLGINYFKLVKRDFETDRILKIVTAYLAENYKGNLCDIIDFKQESKQYNLVNKFIFFIKILKKNKLDTFNIIKTLQNTQKKFTPYIDNGSLKHFLDYFLKKKNSCLKIDCSSCNYCKNIASKHLKFSSKERNLLLQNYNKLQSFW